MNELDDNDIPYSFIRIGEEIDDIECRKNWTSDMPSEIESFEPVVDVNDDEWGSYEDVFIDTKPPTKPEEDSDSHIKSVMFSLFEEYSDYVNIKHSLRTMNSEGKISDAEYDLALERWDKYLAEWTTTRAKLD